MKPTLKQIMRQTMLLRKFRKEWEAETYLFTQLGSSQVASTTGNILGLDATAGLLYNGQNASDLTIYYIDSIVRVVGANTGYRLDIPVRYVKIA